MWRMCNGDYNLDCGKIITFSSMNTFEYVVLYAFIMFAHTLYTVKWRSGLAKTLRFYGKRKFDQSFDKSLATTTPLGIIIIKFIFLPNNKSSIIH